MNKKFLSTGKIAGNEKGALLLSVIVIIVIFALLGAAILSITSTSIFTQAYSNRATKAYYMAESGYRYATMNIMTISIGGDDCLKCHSSHGTETIRYSAGYGRLPDDTIKVHGKPYKDLLDGGSFEVRLAPFWFKFRAESGDWDKDAKKLRVHAVASSNLDPEIQCDFPEAFTDGTISGGGLYLNDKYIKYTGIDATGFGNGTLIFTGVDPDDISLPEDGVLINVFPACRAKQNQILSKNGELLINNAAELYAFPNTKSVIEINNKLITYEHVDVDNGKLIGLGNVDEDEDVFGAGLNISKDDIIILSKTLKITSTGKYPDADENAAVKTLEYYRWVGKPLTVPIVYNTAKPDEDKLLAGGNFHWVSDVGGNDDTRGHNVLEISGVDGNLGEAPGSNAGCGSCHSNLAVELSFFLQANGLNGGCRGCHLDVNHQADSSGLVTKEPWYRFLSGHETGAGMGVIGIEHEKWNNGAAPSSHNEYLGKDQPDGFGFGLGNTTTAYCTGCHGQFHDDQREGDNESDYGKPWVRHPSDWVIKDDGEFADAFGAEGSGTGTYDPDLPVARTSLAGGVSNEVTLGSDMVMCLSCHHAHGSPYDDSLRWDTNSRDSSINKCITCHTRKTLDLHYSESTDCRSCHTMHDGVVGLLKP